MSVQHCQHLTFDRQDYVVEDHPVNVLRCRKCAAATIDGAQPRWLHRSNYQTDIEFSQALLALAVEEIERQAEWRDFLTSDAAFDPRWSSFNLGGGV